MAETPSPTPEKVQEISDWLIEAALATRHLTELVEGYCTRLAAAGMGIRRVNIGTRVLHPTQEARTVRWARDSGMETLGFEFGSADQQAWRDSPIRAVIEAGGRPLRRRLEGPDAELDFPILAELRAEGDTDYIALATIFDAYSWRGQPSGMVVTMTTDRPGGFTKVDVATIERLQPRLAVAVKCSILPEIAQDVVSAYLGADAGRRILSGEVGRGDVGELDAILFFCDLRGFTGLADRMDLKRLIELLDTYFDAIVTPIEDCGGQVLKFLGDGLLATFSLDGDDPAPVCRRALDSALRALAAVDEINAARRGRAMPALDLDVALHQGRVIYGNVGARNRLDFTVIGPAVNEASRMEALCDALGVHLVLSQSFVAAAGPAPAGSVLSAVTRSAASACRETCTRSIARATPPNRSRIPPQ